MRLLYLFIILLTTSSCYQVNSETSEIAIINASCLDSLAWDKILQEHSVHKIKDSSLIIGLKSVKNHFIKPDYILYFDDEPKEIIGCNWGAIRVVYNENIASHSLTGLSTLLSNKEQKRIRNRVLIELLKHQCDKGKFEMAKEMEKDVPFANSHKNYPL